VSTTVHAHTHALRCVSFDAAGAHIATASVHGTLVRVFALPSAKRLYSFRRGAYAVHVRSLAFNPTATLLALTSDSDTVRMLVILYFCLFLCLYTCVNFDV
jgi:autophagy-related protein 18